MIRFRTAILIVHGFAGGTYDQEYLANKLETIKKYDVYTFTLPGHDGDFREKITYSAWMKKSESMVEFLIENGYKKIYVIGHSMGGVIASYLASKYSEIKKLVLVAPAFRISGFENEKLDLENLFHKTPKMFSQYGVKIIANRMIKLPPNCFIEFSRLVRKYQNCIKDVKIPTLIFRGTVDTIVPQESVEHAYNSVDNKYKKIIMLDNISHDVFRENKTKITTNMIIKFFEHKSSILNMDSYIKENDK